MATYSDMNEAVRAHYRRLMELPEPWCVDSVTMDPKSREVTVVLSYPPDTPVACPTCGKECSVYDHRKRRRRHPAQMAYRTIVECDVPRCDCPEHGKHLIEVPWAEPRGRFTLEFEAFALMVLSNSDNLTQAARILDVSWDTVQKLQERAVSRGMRRRKEETVAHVGLDEKSFLSRHRYATVMTDIDGSRVLEVVRGRDGQAAHEALEALSPTQREGVVAVAADFLDAYATAATDLLPNAELVHDKFHVTAYLTKAVDLVRRKEHRELTRAGDDALKGTKYLWLSNRDNWRPEQKQTFRQLRSSTLKVGRAFAIKEAFRHFWDYIYEGSAEKFYKRWRFWATHSRLAPVKAVAATFHRHKEGLFAYLRHRITNAFNESANASIQNIKSSARGFRNFQNFRNAILFQCGGLQMDPHKNP